MSAQVTYVAYTESGQITSIVKGPRAAIEAPDGLYLEYEGEEEVKVDWYVSGQEVLPKPEQPSAEYVFDYSAGQWAFDLELAKIKKWDSIKTQRNAQEFGSFQWGDYTFDCNEVSQRRIQGAVQLAAIDSDMTLEWTLSDNSVQIFTAAEYIQIGQALATHVSQCHERGRILRQEINQAATESELEAIVW
jgi:hypothetical protein